MQHSESVALRQQLAVLRENFTQLAGQLSQAAQELQDAGAPPSANLTDDLAACHSAFSGLCGEILSMAGDLAVSPPPTPGEMTSLSKLDGLLKVVTEAEEKKGAVEQTRMEALRTLEQVLSITHSDNAAFRPLLECQATARELHNALSTITWPETHSDMQTLADGKHPLASLLSLVNSVDELDDEKWGLCQNVVEQAFGKSLAVAALRGRLGCSRQTLSAANRPAQKMEEKTETSTPVAAASPAPQAGWNTESVAGVKSHPSAVGINGTNGANRQSPPTVATGSAQPAVQAVKNPAGPKSPPLTSPIAQTQKGEPAPPVQPVPAAQAIAQVVQVVQVPNGVSAQHATGATSQPAEPPVGNVPPPASLLSALNALETLDIRDTQTSSGVTNGQAQALNQVVHSNSRQASPQVSTQIAQMRKKEVPPSADAVPPAEGSARARAALILNGKPEGRPTALRDLIYQLLIEDKLSLAFHMTRCLGAQFPDLQPRPPVWLLRSIVLARYVQGAGGNLAQLLKEDLGYWSQNEAENGVSEWGQVIGNWSVAAALQPALFGSQTRAPAVLHAVQLSDDLPQLSAYCRLIGDFGNKRQPLDPVVFRKRKDQTAWQEEIDSLRQTVESWWNRAPRVSLAYEPATKVWRKWQEPKGLLHSLLLAIRQNDPTKLPISQRVVEKLSEDAQLKREVQHTDRDIMGRVLGDDIAGKHLDQLRGLVREGVGFARHWIELQEARPSRPVPKQAEQLRQEVRHRHEAVLEELHTFQQRHPSLACDSSVVCCQKALEGVWNIFNPENGSVASEELTPRVLLGEELLRVPFLSVDEKGEVSGADPESVIDVVLDLLANGLLDDE